MNKDKEFKTITTIAIILSIFLSVFGWKNIKTHSDLSDTRNSVQLLQSDLDETKANLKIESEKASHALSELEIANQTVADLKDKEYELIYLGDFKLTHYCNEFYEHICGYGNGLTATGTNVTPGRTIAVDPKVIPYGTKVYIEGYGWRVAEDCGGAIKGNHIDVAVDTHENAMDTGVKHGGVWILVEKNS